MACAARLCSSYQADPNGTWTPQEGRLKYLYAAALAVLLSAPLADALPGDPAPSGTTMHSGAAKSTLSLPIFYDPALAVQGFPNPLVKAAIAGHEALFIVDSGASVNVLADWYAEIVAIPTVTTADSKAKGSDGKTTEVRLAQQLEGRWSDGQRLALNEAIVVSFPPLFKSLHLGGLISPQLLAPVGMAAVLDLKRPSLRFVPLARALSHLQRSKAPMFPLAMTQVCRNADSQLVNRQYLAAVTSAGVTDLVLVDTGATTDNLL